MGLFPTMLQEITTTLSTQIINIWSLCEFYITKIYKGSNENVYIMISKRLKANVNGNIEGYLDVLTRKGKDLTK